MLHTINMFPVWYMMIYETWSLVCKSVLAPECPPAQQHLSSNILLCPPADRHCLVTSLQHCLYVKSTTQRRKLLKVDKVVHL